MNCFDCEKKIAGTYYYDPADTQHEQPICHSCMEKIIKFGVMPSEYEFKCKKYCDGEIIID